MSLLHRTVTPRMLAANRRNARFSTGPRTPQGKANSRLNNLRHGVRSAIRQNYFYFWLSLVLADPRQPGYVWDMTKLPIPLSPHPESSPWRREEMREFLFTVAPYPHSRPSHSFDPLASFRGRRKKSAGEGAAADMCF